MTLQDYDRILEEAFSFLVSDFHYSSQPAQPGSGRFGGLSKTFTLDRRTIVLWIADPDSTVFCDVLFSDGEEEQVEFSRRHFRYRSLYLLLQRKGVDVDFPDNASLGSDAAKTDALVACARLVREHAIDVVNGNFSAFPALAYVVHHVDRKYPTGEVRRLIGVYSSFSEAMKAISHRRTKPGFVVRQDGFEVDCFEVDRGDWPVGIPISPSQQETEFFMRVSSATRLAEFNEEERRQIQAQWLMRFSGFEELFEVWLAKTYPIDRPEREAVLVRYPRDHYAWSVVLDGPELQRRRCEFIDELRNRPMALECWREARASGNLSSRFVAFIDEGMRTAE